MERTITAKDRAEYDRKMLDARWVNFANRIKNERGQTCERCGWRHIERRVENRYLSVHHIGYEWGINPWDYEDWEVVVLCSACHAKVHRKEQKIHGAN